MEIIISWLVRRARLVRKCPAVRNNYERSFASIRGTNDIMSPRRHGRCSSPRCNVFRIKAMKGRASRVVLGVGLLDRDRGFLGLVVNEPHTQTHTHTLADGESVIII